MILRVTLDRIPTFTFGAKKNLNRRNRQKFKSIFYIVIYFEMKRISCGMLKVKKKTILFSQITSYIMYLQEKCIFLYSFLISWEFKDFHSMCCVCFSPENFYSLCVIRYNL